MQQETPQPDVEVSDLKAAYGAEVVLRDVSFAVNTGEIFGILGGSGSGKSTILRHLIGLQEPAAGTIRVLGHDLARTRPDTKQQLAHRFGVLFQAGALFGSMTVAENVALPLQEFTRLPRSAIESIVRLKLSLVGLAGAEGLLPAELSGGMRKRAGLARAMALDPQLLFFDEPSSGLDPILAAELDRLILQLRDTLGTTMVVVTHDLDSVLTIADRVILVDRVRKGVIAQGRPRDLAAAAEPEAVREFFTRGGLRGSTPAPGATVPTKDAGGPDDRTVTPDRDGSTSESRVPPSSG